MEAVKDRRDCFQRGNIMVFNMNLGTLQNLQLAGSKDGGWCILNRDGNPKWTSRFELLLVAEGPGCQNETFWIGRCSSREGRL